MNLRNNQLSCAHGLRQLLVAFFAVILSGVVANARPLDPISNDEVMSRLSELEGLPWTGKSAEKPDGWLGDCHRSVVTIEVGDAKTGEVFPLSLTLIRPDVNKPVPVMLLIPTMEGVTVVERSAASNFCSLGIATIVTDVNNNQVPSAIPSWGLEDQRNRHSILSVRATIDFAQSSVYFDSSKVGLMGFSLGAITSSFIAGIEPDRLATVVLVLAGGDLPYILSVSDNGRVRDLRDQRMQHEKIRTPAEYEEILRTQMRYDPLYFAPRAIKDKLFMVLSTSDTKVPSTMQTDLFNAFGQPSSTTFSSGHIQTILSLTYFYFNYVTDFVQKKFGMKPSFRGGIKHDFITDPKVPADIPAELTNL